MTQIGIMLEGQDGLNWERWGRILQAAEDFGYQCVFRSDHFTNSEPPDKDSLELWVSLTYAAISTRRIEFGSCVSPVTFRHPAMTVRMAAAVDDLSDGRLVLGLGAGWQDREHHNFGVPFMTALHALICLPKHWKLRPVCCTVIHQSATRANISRWMAQFYCPALNGQTARLS